MTATTQTAGSAARTCPASRQPAGPGSAARSARSSPRSARCGRPTGRWSRWSWSRSASARCCSWGRVQGYASQPAAIQAHVAARIDVARDAAQPVRADPRPADHRRARCAHDHLGVLDRHDQDVADRDAAPRSRVRGQGRGVRVVAPGHRAGRRRSAPSSSASRSCATQHLNVHLGQPGCAARGHRRRAVPGCVRAALLRPRRGAAAHGWGDHGVRRRCCSCCSSWPASCRTAGRCTSTSGSRSTPAPRSGRTSAG